MANVEKGLLEVQRMSCAGMTLSCQLKVHSCLWTATEVSTQHAGLSPRRAAPGGSPPKCREPRFPATPAHTRAAQGTARSLGPCSCVSPRAARPTRPSLVTGAQAPSVRYRGPAEGGPSGWVS